MNGRMQSLRRHLSALALACLAVLPARSVRAATTLELTAAGGITTVADIRALMDMNIHAAIGMAVYTGRLSLTELAGMHA